jgi:hypothetical protein
MGFTSQSVKVLPMIDPRGLHIAEVVVLNLVAEQIRPELRSTIARIRKKGSEEKSLEIERLRRSFAVPKFRISAGPHLLGC